MSVSSPFQSLSLEHFYISYKAWLQLGENSPFVLYRFCFVIYNIILKHIW